MFCQTRLSILLTCLYFFATLLEQVASGKYWKFIDVLVDQQKEADNFNIVTTLYL